MSSNLMKSPYNSIDMHDYCTQFKVHEWLPKPKIPADSKNARGTSKVWIIFGYAVIAGFLLGLLRHVINDILSSESKPVKVLYKTCICENIANDIVHKNGSVTDATIATLLCQSVIMPLRFGLDWASPNTGSAETTIAKDAYTGVHSEMLILWQLHKENGHLPWKLLFQPSIKLCRKGVYVTETMANNLLHYEEYIRAVPELQKVFLNNKTNCVLKKGEIMYRPILADMLELIAEHGSELLDKSDHLTKLLAKRYKNRVKIVVDNGNMALASRMPLTKI